MELIVIAAIVNVDQCARVNVRYVRYALNLELQARAE